jgi:WD40 repeat protein
VLDRKMLRWLAVMAVLAPVCARTDPPRAPPRPWHAATVRLAAIVDDVQRVALSPDGELAATVSTSDARHDVTVWDVATGIDRYTIHDAVLPTFGPSRMLAVLSVRDDGWLIVDAYTGRIARTLPTSTGPARFAPDGALVTLGEEVVEWDAATGRERSRDRLTGRPAIELGLSRDGSTVAAWAGADSYANFHLAIWRRDGKGRAARTVPLPGLEVRAVAVSPTGARVALAVMWSAGDKTPPGLYVIDTETLTVTTVPALAHQVEAAAFLDDGTLVSAFGDRLQVRDPSGRLVREIPTGLSNVRNLAAAGGVVIAAGRGPGNVSTPPVVFDPRSGRRLRALGRRDGVTALAWSADGARLAHGAVNGHTTIWNVVRGERELDLAGTRPPRSLAFAPDGRVAIARLWDTTVTVHAPDGRRLAALETKFEYTRVRFHGDHLVTAWGELWPKVWDSAFVEVTPGREEWLAAGRSPSPEGGSFAVTDGAWILVHDAERIRSAFRTPARIVTEVVWIAGGLAAGDETGQVRLWDVGGASRGVLGEQPHPVSALAARPDGRTLAIGRPDGTVELWDVPSRTRLVTLAAPAGTHWLVAAGAHVDGELAADSPVYLQIGDAVRPWQQEWRRRVRPHLLAMRWRGDRPRQPSPR